MIQQILTGTVWFIFVFFTGGTVVWLFLYLLGKLYEEPEREWESEDIQVRIITRGDSPQVARRTANAAKRIFNDVRIITDREIETAPGVKLEKVPKNFNSSAIDKGRALDWAQKNIDCEKEYILYLDEDTKVTGFDGIPDADIVQFLEKPEYTESVLSFFIESARVGFQQEVLSFPKIRYPLYLWGGAFAVKKNVEDEVGWNTPTIAEDTAFLWRAINTGKDFKVTKQRYINQSPLSVKSLIQQRRRWFSGTVEAIQFIPYHWKLFVILRNFFAASSIATFYVILVGVFSMDIPLILSVTLGVGLLLWSFIGAMKYDKSFMIALGSLVLFPILHTINSAGVVYGMIDRSDSFEVTDKK